MASVKIKFYIWEAYVQIVGDEYRAENIVKFGRVTEAIKRLSGLNYGDYIKHNEIRPHEIYFLKTGIISDVRQKIN